MPETEPLALTLPIRRLVEFLLRSGSIDSRFTGFDRANEGARLHRKLQRAAVKEYPDYEAEAALRQEFGCEGITYTLEGRADGLFTDRDGMRTIDGIEDHNPAAGVHHRRAERPSIGPRRSAMRPYTPCKTICLPCGCG